VHDGEVGSGLLGFSEQRAVEDINEVRDQTDRAKYVPYSERRGIREGIDTRGEEAEFAG